MEEGGGRWKEVEKDRGRWGKVEKGGRQKVLFDGKV